MFKKLKDKIAEEVKSSPQRIQQMAQAVVSSASSNPTEVSSDDTFFSIAEEDTPQNSPAHSVTPGAAQISSTSTTITSPSGRVNTLSSSNHDPWGRQSSPYQVNGTNRTRRLSNSSVGSDVSFRLPTYDSPAVYHLQSDLDVSEVEDYNVVPSGQLDLVSKEQLHQAYRKALDRYQKYRGRYTELARRYRELERDNNKARSVLVETQDKALRRISELREQCSLEQQAKAHLESALRMDIDEKECIIQSLKTKLSEENCKETNVKDDTQSSLTEDLVDLSPVPPEQLNLVTNENSLIDLTTKPEHENLSEKMVVLTTENKSLTSTIQKLEELLSKYKEKMGEAREKNVKVTNDYQMKCEEFNKTVTEYEQELNVKNNNVKRLEDAIKKLKKFETDFNAKHIESENYKKESKLFEEKWKSAKMEIEKLQKIEEENSILLAENKLVIHKELEKKEVEVKTLQSKVLDLETKITNISIERNVLTEKVHDLENGLIELNNLRAENGDLCVIIKTFERDCENLKARNDQLENDLKNVELANTEIAILKKMVAHCKTEKSEWDIQMKEIITQNAQLNENVQRLEQTIKEINKEKITLQEQCGIVTKENEDFNILQDKLKQMIEEKYKIECDYAELNYKYENLLERNQSLNDEIENSEIIDLRNELSAIKKQCKAFEISWKELNVKYEAAIKQQELLEADKVNLVGELGALKVELSEKNKSVQQIIEEKYKIECDYAELNNKYENLLKKNLSLNDEIENSLNFNEKSDSEITDLRNELSEIKKQCKSLEISWKELNVKYEAAIKQQQLLEADKENLVGELGVLKVELSENKSVQLQLEKDLADSTENLVALKKQLSDVEKQNAVTLSEQQRLHETFNEKISNLINSCETLTHKNNELTESLNEKENVLKQSLDKYKKLEKSVSDDRTSLQENLKKVEDLKKEKELLNEKLLAVDNLSFELEACKKNVTNVAEKLEISQNECARLGSENDTLKNELLHLNEQLVQLAETNRQIAKEKQDLDDEMSTYKNHFSNFGTEKEILVQTISTLKQQIENLTKHKTAIETRYAELKNNYEENLEIKNKNITELTLENNKLRVEYEKKVAQNISFVETVGQLTDNVDNLKMKNDKLKKEILNLGKENKLLNEELSKRNKICNDLQQHNDELTNKLIKFDDVHEELNLSKLKIEHYSTITEDNDVLKSENAALKTQLEDYEIAKQKYKQLENIDTSLESLQIENKSLDRQLHEQEKTIQKLHEDKHYLNNQLSQIEGTVLNKDKELSLLQLKLQELETAFSEKCSLEEKVKSLESINKLQYDEIHEKLVNENKQLLLKLEDSEHRLAEVMSLKESYGKIETENNHLQQQLNDIESKYNTSEKSVDSRILNLNHEIVNYTERIKDLEAKCQDYDKLIQSNIMLNQETEVLTKQLSEMDLNSNMPANNEKLLSEKQELEIKLNEIMADVVEVSNKNVMLEHQCENFNILKKANERLTLTNEKLARQLDEMLVTARHANTESISHSAEFEYLRNILYQYLSGGVGALSGANTGSTLVRVIAAVMKFDSNQTQAVLDKEAQRNTLLGQLNLV